MRCIYGIEVESPEDCNFCDVVECLEEPVEKRFPGVGAEVPKAAWSRGSWWLPGAPTSRHGIGVFPSPMLFPRFLPAGEVSAPTVGMVYINNFLFREVA